MMWQKLGLVFSPETITDRPWLKAYVQAPCTLVLDQVVRVFFSSHPEIGSDGSCVSYTGYVDLDRNDLFRQVGLAMNPVLALGETGCFDEFGVSPMSVIQDGAQLTAFYGGWARCESVPYNVAIGRAVSHDNGAIFSRSGPGPALSYSVDEPFILSDPKIRKYDDKWVLFYTAGRKWKIVGDRPEPVRKIRMATSLNGLDWTLLNRDVIESRVEIDEVQASPDVIFKNGRYHMFFCYRHSQDNCSGEFGYRVGYGWSLDLKSWTREDHRCGIVTSDEGWDSEMISHPHVFELDGSTYMLYVDNQFSKSGLRLARLQGELS